MRTRWWIEVTALDRSGRDALSLEGGLGLEGGLDFEGGLGLENGWGPDGLGCLDLDGSDGAIEIAVEAKGWRDALEQVRRQRNESGPLSFEAMGKAIRALDVDGGWRYVVAQVPTHKAVASYLQSSGRAEPSVAYEVVVSRDHDATAELPLTYRERGVCVGPEVSAAAAATLLQSLLEELRGDLRKLPPGQVCELAAFAAGHDEAGQLPPALVTLSYKDWRGEALLRVQGRPEATQRIALESRLVVS